MLIDYMREIYADYEIDKENLNYDESDIFIQDKYYQKLKALKCANCIFYKDEWINGLLLCTKLLRGHLIPVESDFVCNHFKSKDNE